MKSDVLALDVQDFRNALVPFVLGLFTPGSVETRIMMANANNLRGQQAAEAGGVDGTARPVQHAIARQRIVACLTAGMGAPRQVPGTGVQPFPRVDTVPSYNVVNLHFEYEFADAPLSLALSVTNLLDKDGINNVFTNPYGLWTTSHELIPPREVIASVKYRFE